MNASDRKRYGSAIGIGMMYLWACTLMFWSNYGVVGYIGYGLACASGVAVFVYIDSLENDLKEANRRLMDTD